MKIFSGKESLYFTNKVCEKLGVRIGLSERINFSDGEFVHGFGETVRGENVYLIQSTFQPIDILFELLQNGDSSKWAGSKIMVA